MSPLAQRDTFSASTVFVVIPSYNEGAVLPSTIAPLLAAGYSIVVVDDGSRDRTWDLITKLPVTAVRHITNLGQGAAIMTGMAAALRAGASIVVHFDADGQHPAAQIPSLIEPILANHADIVFGSRFLRPQDLRQVPVVKRIALRAGIVVSGLLTGIWLSDTHNGFRALSRKAIEKICLRENGFAHATEILGEVRSLGLRYVERPVTIHYSDYSKRKGQSLLGGLNIVADLLSSRFFR